MPKMNEFCYGTETDGAIKRAIFGCVSENRTLREVNAVPCAARSIGEELQDIFLF